MLDCLLSTKTCDSFNYNLICLIPSSNEGLCYMALDGGIGGICQ